MKFFFSIRYNLRKRFLKFGLTFAFNNSYCIRDISRLGAKRRRRHSETCEAVSETSGWSPVAITKPRGLSVEMRLIKLLQTKYLIQYFFLTASVFISYSSKVTAIPVTTIYIPGEGKLINKSNPLLEAMHPKAQIDFVKRKVKNREQPYYDTYLQLIQYADSAFQHPSHALADFNVPGYYVDAAAHRKNSLSLQSDAFDAYACALAYRLTGKKKYAKEARRFLKAWAEVNDKYSNADGPLVMVYSGTAMIIAADLINNYKGWKNDDKGKFTTWVKHVYLKGANEIRNKKNNWGDWGRFGSILSACLLGDTSGINENIRLIKSDLLEKIADDGHMPHETVRGNNGIWYTYFSLAPITASAWVAYNATGENIFTYTQDDRSIKKAVDYLYYYNLHPAEWKWFKNPNQGSPAKWPGNLFEALSDVYNDPRLSTYAEPARPIIYNLHHFAWTFPTLMKVQLSGYK